MPHDQSTTDDAPSQDAAAQTHDTDIQTPDVSIRAPETHIYEPVDEREEWIEGPIEDELPRRPRRRLLGVGANPIPLMLIGVLLIACGFIGGVLLEKGESSSSSGPSASGSLASRFAALRSGASATGASATGAGTTGTGTTGAGATGGRGGGATGAFAGGAGGGIGATVGQVAYLSGDTLYVTTSEGNTVKVSTSAASTVTKTVKSDVKSIHPGETVIVTGSAGTNGAVSAESIRVSEAGASGGGLGALFGGGGGASGGDGRRRGGGGSSGEPALFGG